MDARQFLALMPDGPRWTGRSAQGQSSSHRPAHRGELRQGRASAHLRRPAHERLRRETVRLLRDRATGVGEPPGFKGRAGTKRGRSADYSAGPAIFRNVEAAPDGRHILVERVRHPYSYLVPFEDFPGEIEVWNRSGRLVYKVASLPLHETTPLGGVPLGPRDFSWQATAPATLIWVEALDEGNPRKKVTPRDRVMGIDVAALQPDAQPSEWFKTEERFAGIEWGERGDLALVWDYDRDQQRRRGYFFDSKQPGASMRRVWDLSVQERYKNPGRPVMRMLPSGHSAMVEDGSDIFLEGEGASPEGNRPFLDRFDVSTLQSTRLFHCDEKSLESFAALLAADGSKFLTRHETPTDPPNYFIRTASGGDTAFTHFPNHVPQLAGIKKELVKYQRPDGVGLSMTLYLPPDYKPGERRPAVMWAYPYEYTSAALASQVTGSPNTFTEI